MVTRWEKAPMTINKLSTPVLRETQNKIIDYFAFFFFAYKLIIWKLMPKKLIWANKKRSSEYEQTVDDLVYFTHYLLEGFFKRSNLRIS